jgi:hypothetical protein
MQKGPCTHAMNSRQRLRETFRYGKPDRVPYFEEAIREEVITCWRKQGLPVGADPLQMFPSDRLEEFEPDLQPHPGLASWPSSEGGLARLRHSLDPETPGRFPGDWHAQVRRWRARDHVLMAEVHRGFFLSMGVHGWGRFAEVACLLRDKPSLVHAYMEIQGDFAARMTDKLLREVEIDAAVFSEPIGGNTGPLISPRMYEDFVLTSYEPVLDVLAARGVEIIIFRTYANARLLLASCLKRGFNCLWASEVNTAEMDYRDIRKEFGRDLRLIGGIDLDALRRGREAIRREIMEKVPPLLDSGGYVPLADGRVREDVSYNNYVYYRELLAEVTRGR